jgi:hypothetical protein
LRAVGAVLGAPARLDVHQRAELHLGGVVEASVYVCLHTHTHTHTTIRTEGKTEEQRKGELYRLKSQFHQRLVVDGRDFLPGPVVSRRRGRHCLLQDALRALLSVDILLGRLVLLRRRRRRRWRRGRDPGLLDHCRHLCPTEKLEGCDRSTPPPPCAADSSPQRSRCSNSCSHTVFVSNSTLNLAMGRYATDWRIARSGHRVGSARGV